MTIYIIKSEIREDEDKFIWINKAFTNKQLAESTINSWQQYAHNSGASYSLIELELITDPFMEAVLLTTKR